MKMNRPLGKSIRTTFMIFAVVPMALAVITCLIAINGSYENTIMRDAESDILGIGRGVEELVQRSLDITEMLASDEDIIFQMATQKTLDTKTKDIINAVLFSNKDIMQLHILSRNGSFRYSTGSIPNIFKLTVFENSGIFRQLNNAKTAVRATKYYSYTDKQIALNAGTAIYDTHSDTTGYVIMDIKHEALDNILKDYHSTYVMDITLIDDRGVVAYNLSKHIKEGVTVQDEWTLDRLQSPLDGWAFSDAYVLTIDNLKLVAKVNNNFVRPLMLTMSIGLAVMALIVLGVAFFSGTMLSGHVTKQFRALWRVIQRAPATGFTEKFIPRDTDYLEVVQLGEYFNETSNRTRELIANIEEKQKRLASAELSVLKAQLRPHFLYNVLNDIKAMAKLGKNKEIVQMVVCFGTLIRSALSAEEELYAVSEEVDLLVKYIEMQNLRGLRPIHMKIQIDENVMDMKIPRLILQPLVENATGHGLATKEKPVILVRGRRTGEKLEFLIADNGCGMRNVEQLKQMEKGVFHQGIGLNNIAKRLHLYYGADGKLEIRSMENRYTVVCITIPSC